MHIELFLEEPSAEAFFNEFLPRILPTTTFRSHVFQGKADLLTNVERRLKGYRSWIPADWRIIVLVDEDRQDCRKLKQKLEAAAAAAGLKTKTLSRGAPFVVLNRIAVEELEAWFLGDPDALHAAYPRVSPALGRKVQFRNPDAVAGGTWEALERVLQDVGYYQSGLPKIELARSMARYMDAGRNCSGSFQSFLQGLAAL